MQKIGVERNAITARVMGIKHPNAPARAAVNLCLRNKRRKEAAKEIKEGRAILPWKRVRQGHVVG